MSLDLELDDAQRAIVSSVAEYCRRECSDERLRNSVGKLPSDLWSGLADLGVLALRSEDGDGGALEVVAAMEALGAALFPGPLVATFFAVEVLDGKARSEIADGTSIVSVGTPPLMPWAPLAGAFIEIRDERAWRAEPRGPVRAVDTLAAEPWGRVELERTAELGPPERVVRAGQLSDVARAAYLAAAGQRLVDAAAAHARNRVQFGRPIGDFQAVAHPLADCASRLLAARTLARVAAFWIDRGSGDAGVQAATARLSAGSAALESAHVAHQVFGAVGITLEGPAFAASRCIRQLVSLPPGEAFARASVLTDLGL